MNWRKYFVILFSMVLPLLLLAQEDLFTQAENDFNHKQYEQALSKFHKLEKDGQLSAALFFNIGTCYYFVNDTVNSIVYLERAAYLAPADKEIAHNLRLAYLKTHNEFEPIPPLPWTTKFNALLMSKRGNSWLTLALICNVLFFTALLLHKFINKKIFTIFAVVALVLGLSSLLLFFQQKRYLNSSNYAIVLPTQQSLKDAPNNQAKNLENLYKGYRVEVLDSLDNWFKISFEDKEGWVEKENVIKI